MVTKEVCVDDSLETDEGNEFIFEGSRESALANKDLEGIVVEVRETVVAGTGTPNGRPGPLQICLRKQGFCLEL